MSTESKKSAAHKTVQKIDNKNGYDLWSKTYDTDVNSTVAIDELKFPPLYSHLTHQRVLEIGCGTGRHTMRLAAQGNHVLALDQSAGMLEKARSKIESQRVEFVEGDFFTHPFPAEPFDAALTSLVVEHIRDLDGFFARVSGLLKVGGEFFVSEIHPQRIGAGTQANFKTGDSEDSYFLESFAHSIGAIEAAAERAGFQLWKKIEAVGDDEFAGLHPQWEKHRGRPLIMIWVFLRS